METTSVKQLGGEGEASGGYELDEAECLLGRAADGFGSAHFVNEKCPEHARLVAAVRKVIDGVEPFYTHDAPGGGSGVFDCGVTGAPNLRVVCQTPGVFEVFAGDEKPVETVKLLYNPSTGQFESNRRDEYHVPIPGTAWRTQSAVATVVEILIKTLRKIQKVTDS